MVILQQLSVSHTPLSELRKPVERYADSGEVNVEVPDPTAVIDRVAAAFPSATHDRTDGLTVDSGDWWFNLRPSNTEPLLRINVEAPNPEACKEYTARLVELVKEGA